jgi:hypothetical protein
MTIADREKLASLTSNLWFDFCLTKKSDNEFRELMHTFDRLTGGTLSACKFLLDVKKLMQEKNEMELSKCE